MTGGHGGHFNCRYLSLDLLITINIVDYLVTVKRLGGTDMCLYSKLSIRLLV